MTALVLNCLAYLYVSVCTHVLVQAQVSAHRTPPGITQHTQRRVRQEREPQEVIPAVLTKREDEGKTKSTGNTKRNVP